MPFLLIRHKVKNYARWKPCFDEHAATRKASGSKSARLFRSAANPNEVIALFEWDSLELAERFSQSENLRAVMQESGVAEPPDIFLLDDVETFPA